MLRFAVLVPLLLLSTLAAFAAPGRDDEGPVGPAPEKNFSNIHSDIEWVEIAFRKAHAAAEEENWAVAARSLQAVIDTHTSRESPGDAAPYVRAVQGQGTVVYEGAWIVARHTLASWGEAALESYAEEYGATATEALKRAARRRSEAGLTAVATRFLPLPAGRRAALLLVDLALERSDPDSALQWIEALEDLEAVSGETPETLARWKSARIERQALAIAKDAASVPAIRKALAQADPSDRKGDPRTNLDPVDASLERKPAPPRAWLTSGGNAARSALPAALGSAFRLKWVHGPGDGALADTVDPAPQRTDRPSVWLPPRAVTDGTTLFVSDGNALHVYDVETGRRLPGGRAAYPGARVYGIGTDSTEDRRLRLGLLEGHTLTLHPVHDFEVQLGSLRRSFSGAGHLVLAAVPDGNKWPVERHASSETTPRNDHLQAFFWDGKQLEPLWRIGGRGDRAASGRLPPDTRLYGAPVVYRGRVWVAGIRPAHATPDRWEAWVYSVDPRTGKVVTRTHIGTGTPMRASRMDEVIPTSPAAARGRIVVSTALGMLAAVDAHDARIQWIFRYDRNVETERGRRRNRDRRDVGLRPTSFFNEPPILALDRCYVTPTDASKVLVLFDRPRGRGRGLESSPDFSFDRFYVSDGFIVEHVAGVVPSLGGRASRLVMVGKGESGSMPGPMVVVYDALDHGKAWPMDEERKRALWLEHSPTGFGAEPYGRALVTAEEAFVPTRHGIAIYELSDRDGDGSHYLGVLNTADVPEAMRASAPEAPYGNLIPIPGRGILAVSATTIAYWERQP